MHRDRRGAENLVAQLGVVPGQVIAVIGAGGKTTLMMKLAAALSAHYRVLVTTTTHILEPTGTLYDVDIMTPAAYLKTLAAHRPTTGTIYVYGSAVVAIMDDGRRKLSGYTKASFEMHCQALLKHFDIILIEADGSRQKPFKGWSAHEPVIPDTTNVTVGVLGAHQLGAPIDDVHVHRLDVFKSYLEGHETAVTKEVLLNVATHTRGMFLKAQGARAIYLAGASKALADWFEEKLIGYDIQVIRDPHHGDRYGIGLQ
jgi:probable selenium-dependent hydroxylase accessory protein YqeC